MSTGRKIHREILKSSKKSIRNTKFREIVVILDLFNPNKRVTLQRATGKSTLSKPDYEETTNNKELETLRKQQQQLNKDAKKPQTDVEELVVNWQTKIYSKVTKAKTTTILLFVLFLNVLKPKPKERIPKILESELRAQDDSARALQV